MRLGRKARVLILSSFPLMLSVNALAATSEDSPYQGIVDRNVFNLKPPTPTEVPPPPPPPPPKIMLTGITTILGNKRALMKVQVPAKPPEPAKEQSYILPEGQSEGEIEVLEIDEKAGLVKVRNHGVEELLDITKDAPKLPTGGPPPAVVTPRGQIPRPVANLPTLPAPPVGSGLKQIPTRPLRAQPIPAPGTPQQ